MPRQEKKREQKPDRIREEALDKTLADSFPTSDPPSSIPNPEDRDTTGAHKDEEQDKGTPNEKLNPRH